MLPSVSTWLSPIQSTLEGGCWNQEGGGVGIEREVLESVLGDLIVYVCSQARAGNQSHSGDSRRGGKTVYAFSAL